MAEPLINILLTRVGVSMGDHAESVVTAVEVDNEETVGQLVTRLLTEPAYFRGGARTPNPENYLTVRIVQRGSAAHDEPGSAVS